MCAHDCNAATPLTAVGKASDAVVCVLLAVPAGLYTKLASLDPNNQGTVQAAFAARPYVAACKYSYNS